MSKPKASYTFGWTDPRMPKLDAYVYEVRPTAWHAWVPGCKWEVVKVYDVTAKTEVLATVDSRETAEGFIKLLKEN
jgi:hypothetical protein